MVKWDGEAGSIANSGRPRISPAALDKSIVRLVFKYRGGVEATVGFVKKKVAKARAFPDSMVERRLGEAGLKWLKRRRKSLVQKKHKRMIPR